MSSPESLAGAEPSAFAELPPETRQQWLVDQAVSSLHPDVAVGNFMWHGVDTLIAVGDAVHAGDPVQKWTPPQERIASIAFSEAAPVAWRIPSLLAVARWQLSPTVAAEFKTQADSLAAATLSLQGRFSPGAAKQTALQMFLDQNPAHDALVDLSRRIVTLPRSPEHDALLLQLAKTLVAKGDLAAGGIRLHYEEHLLDLQLARVQAWVGQDNPWAAGVELDKIPENFGAHLIGQLKIALSLSEEEAALDRVTADIERAFPGEASPSLTTDDRLAIVHEFIDAGRLDLAERVARLIPDITKGYTDRAKSLLAVAEHKAKLNDREGAKATLDWLQTAIAAEQTVIDEHLAQETNSDLYDLLLRTKRDSQETADAVTLKQIQLMITPENATDAIAALESSQFNLQHPSRNFGRIAELAVALAEHGHIEQAVDCALRLPTINDPSYSSDSRRSLRSETFVKLAQLYRKQRERYVAQHTPLSDVAP